MSTWNPVEIKIRIMSKIKTFEPKGSLPSGGVLLTSASPFGENLCCAMIWIRRARGLNNPFFMPVRIRMKRIGAKNAPVFRIVVADGRSPRDGKFIEELGTYHPRKKTDNIHFDVERAKYWISKGAKPSDTVASFLKKAAKSPAPAPAAA
jgi:small subunit ribosomal protein S16